MLSLWGKLTKPSSNSIEADEKYYFSTDAGQIVSVDGTGYVIPEIGENAVEKTDYIPLDFADQKIRKLADESTRLRDAYQQHLAELETYYRQSMADTKSHYETVIKDLKAKAQRHVEIRKQMQQQSEDKLNRELKQSEDSIDELRNNMASLNREYQEEVRSLKANIAESARATEIMRAEIATLQSNADKVEAKADARHQQSVADRLACVDVLNSVMHKIEVESMNEELNRLCAALHKVALLQRSLVDLEARNRKQQSGLEAAAQEREEAAAQQMRLAAEIDDLHAQHSVALSDLAAKHAQQAADLQQRYAEELAALRTRLERAEVSSLLSETVGQVVEEQSIDALQSLSNVHSAAMLHHTRGEEQVVRGYEEQLQRQRDRFEEDAKALKKKFAGKLQVASDRLRKAEVAMCVKDLVLTVVERETVATSAQVNPAPVSAKDSPRLSPRAVAAAGAEHQALLHRVSELEVLMEEQRRSYEEQLAAAQQSVVNNDRASSPQTAQPIAVSKGSAPEYTAQQTAELSELLAREASLLAILEENGAAVGRCTADLERLGAEKEACKEDIKLWSRAFLEANGREPNVQDKATVKDKYQRYKTLTNKVKDQEAQLETLRTGTVEPTALLKAVRVQIVQFEASLSQPMAAAGEASLASPVAVAAFNPSVKVGAAVPVMANPPRDTRDAEMQTEDARSALLRRANTQRALGELGDDGAPAAAAPLPLEGLSEDARRIAELTQALEAEALTVEQLDDQLYQLRQDFESLQSERDKIEKERAFLSSQVDALVKEKRTDVVARYEEDIARLNEVTSSLNDKIAALTAEKVKNEARLAELQGRVDVAETELKERDARELRGLDAKDEKAQLKGQITKQREQIILKAKAATAGWDAAAQSEERLDVEVERAFKKGFAEERQKHVEEMKALNAAIEVKENRITELLVAVAAMEKKVMDSDAQVAEMTKATEAMKLEVADTIAALGQMGLSRAGSGAEDGEEPALGPSMAELDSAREQLDQAQEELVGLMERCDRLERELEVARRKNRVYQELAALTGMNSSDIARNKAKANLGGGAGAGAAAVAGKGKGAGQYDVNEVLSIIKKAVAKGTSMWKSNRKDECFDVYLEACQDSFDRLLVPENKNLLSDAMSQGKTLGLQNKQRGAVVLRKALDKLSSDFEKTNGRLAEEEAAAELRGQAADAQMAQEQENSDQVMELVSELDSIEASFLEQGYTKDRNPSNSSSGGTVEASPRAGAGASDAPSSLLARAKAAEAQVASLKKQLAAVVAATAATQRPAAGAAESPVGAAAGGGPAAAAALPGVAGAAALRRGAAGAGGADPAEVRKLNRKIKELEQQLKNNSGAAAAGGAASADLKAMQQAEKALQKKLKDAENNFKRDAKGLEMRAVKAENALGKIEGNYNSVVAERDKLRTENAKLAGLPAELAALQAKTEYFQQVELQLEAKTKDYDVLAEQFKKETALRKKYKNELEDLKGAIRVYARCRPMAKYEIERGCKCVVEVKDETSLRVVTGRGEKDFEFDAVFGMNSTQDQVFEDTKRLVESCMDGYNVCLFAYGQTGSGKTFTMTGSPSLPGLTPKAIDELFRLISERAHLNVRVTTYFVELYNDNLVDLYWILDNKGKAGAEPPKLEIKMDGKKMVFVRNAVIKEARSPAELMELFNTGNVERHTGATKMNAESSRSHSIFAIMVDAYDTATKRATTGKLSLVDLAGSERADKTGASADRLKEAQSINKSLSALGDVIAALSEGSKHVPYRNNKLTQLMQDSLGGNAKTLMFVNFSPADYNADETSTSLMYAARVKKIVNNASKQAESEEVARLKLIIQRLKAGLPADLPAQEEEEEPAPPADDGKIYDDGRVVG